VHPVGAALASLLGMSAAPSTPPHPSDPYEAHVDLLMTTTLTVVREDALLSEAAQGMLEAGVTGLPVVNREGAPVGVLSLRDIVAAHGSLCATCAADAPTVYLGQLTLDQKTLLGQLKTGTTRVNDCMSDDIISCTRWHTVAEAARRMAEAHVHRLMVVDGGKLVGLLSAIDIVGYVGGVSGKPAG
jgi:CBS domain-containing protein